MKITNIATVRVAAFPNLTFVQVRTDEGFVGLGETFYGAAAVEAHVHASIAPQMLGGDPLRREHWSARLAGYTGYSGSGVETRARSAIDLALWDIAGQAAGQPVFNLLGGMTRDSLEIYNTCAGQLYVNDASGQSVSNWGLRDGRFEDLYAAINAPGALARDLLDHDISGMKIWPFDTFAEASGGHHISSRELASALSKVAAIRDEVGMDMNVMIEMHALWDVPTAQIIVRALEEFEPFWVEDPVRSDVAGGLASVAAETSIRVAAGETVAGLSGFSAMLDSRSVDVITVDTTWSGGLTAAQKVASLAESYGIPIAPHDCTGPVALAACVHLGTAIPNALMQETVRAGYLGWYSSLIEGGPAIGSGRISASTTPGLGIRLASDLPEREGTSVRSSGVGVPAMSRR